MEWNLVNPHLCVPDENVLEPESVPVSGLPESVSRGCGSTALEQGGDMAFPDTTGWLWGRYAY